MIKIVLKNKNHHPVVFGKNIDDGMVFEKITDFAPKKTEQEILDALSKFPNIIIEKINEKRSYEKNKGGKEAE